MARSTIGDLRSHWREGHSTGDSTIVCLLSHEGGAEAGDLIWSVVEDRSASGVHIHKLGRHGHIVGAEAWVGGSSIDKAIVGGSSNVGVGVAAGGLRIEENERELTVTGHICGVVVSDLKVSECEVMLKRMKNNLCRVFYVD